VEHPLALYYFHLRDGVDILLDPEGREMEGRSQIGPAGLADAPSIARTMPGAADPAGPAHRRGGRDRAIVHAWEFEGALKIVRSPAHA
jgi:hypothetical protein